MNFDGAVAIVGMACQYPDADSVTRLWHNVLGQRRAFRRIPQQRLSSDYFGESADLYATNVTHAGVLRDWKFDRERFGVPGPLHRSADHTHWLALETAASALADAGYAEGAGLDRDRVGVILGNTLTGEFSRAHTVQLRWPFLARATHTAMHQAGAPVELAADALARLEGLVKGVFSEPNDESLAGGLANTIAGRICNYFDFHGTGFTVDGACASSLLAVMAAARALVSGELSFALAGGVDLSIDPFELIGFARLGALATDEMRVYDRNPTGFLPGEGCGIVALMRAEDANRCGLRSYAHLVGWGTSSDGAGGLTRPGVHGQVLGLGRAYQMAGLDPAEIGYIEGHGTGTAVGDRVELEVLREVRGAGAAKAALGTVKGNIGHTKAAAGIAGLIKAALAVHHRVLPPTTGCQQPHELLDQPDMPLRVLTEPEPWPNMPALAAVSSMGFGGINTHAILAAPTTSRRPSAASKASAHWGRPAPEYDIVLVQANTPAALSERLGEVADYARQLSAAELHDLASTLFHDSETTAPVRACLVAARPDQLAEAAALAGDCARDWAGQLLVNEVGGYALGSGGPARIGLLFPGQAAPVRGQLPPWATTLPVPSLPKGFVVREQDPDTRLAQPAIIRQSLAGVAWLTAVGCQPTVAVGHSLGEIAALVWSAALSAKDGLSLAIARGRLMAKHGRRETTMASVATSAELAGQLLAGTQAVVSGYNSPTQITITGPIKDIEVVLGKAQAAGITATPLRVSHGFHGPAMQPVTGPFSRALRKLTLALPQRLVISTVTGQPITADTDLNELLITQLTAPVRFAHAVSGLAEHCDLAVEVGPGTILCGLLADNASGEQGIPTVSLDCGGPPRRHAMATAALAAAGSADLSVWFAAHPYQHLSLGAPLTFLANPCESLPAHPTPAPVTASKAAPDRVVLPEVLSTTDPLQALRVHLSRVLELPMHSITPDSSLLSDLHLNSLQVVQAVGVVATALGKQPPAPSLSLAEATVNDAALVLAALPEIGEEPISEEVAGVRSWVRAFHHLWTPFEPDDTADPAELVVTVRPADGVEEIAGLLRRIAEIAPASLVIQHHGHPAAAGIGRSVAVELDSCAVTVVEVPEGMKSLPSRLLAQRGYRELRCHADGSVERLGSRLYNPGSGAPSPVGAGDVCVVTGGVRGITTHLGAALAADSGCTLVILGRTPADDPQITDQLQRVAQRVPSYYLSCDVTDPQAVGKALDRAATHGRVRGILHGAGVNRPQRLGSVTASSLHTTLNPKLTGLRSLLEIAGEDLTLVLAFGSIIGRCGLPGQAEYCIANDWMRAELEQWATTHPHCRTHLLEWSLWSGLGMGIQLDVLDTLRRQGVMPIGPDDGVAALRELLADPHAPTTVLLTNRVPPSPTLSIDGPTHRLLRFGEDLPVHIPGVEAVLESTLSLGSDPYLADHVIGEVPVVPAVLGLEAMAQAAAVVDGGRSTWSFTDLQLLAPVTVDERSTRVVRVAALADRSTIDVVLRDDADLFTSDRFTARIEVTPERPSARAPAPAPAARTRPHPYYGSLFFHSGRFQRLIEYDTLSAFRAHAWIQANGITDSPWFSDFHSSTLLLGDPGAHDAAIHVVLACIPHRKVLPVSVERVSVWTAPTGILAVHVVERSHTAEDFVFDVELTTATGQYVARWEGLRVHAIGAHHWPGPLPSGLAGPILTRRLIEHGVSERIELITVPGRREDGTAAHLASKLTGAYRPGQTASASYTAGHLLLALADAPIGVDWQTSPAHPSPAWPDILGQAGRQLANTIANKTGEDLDQSMLRIWCSRESLIKLGTSPDQPLCIDHVTDDGTVITHAGRIRVITTRVVIEHVQEPVIVAIATGSQE